MDWMLAGGGVAAAGGGDWTGAGLKCKRRGEGETGGLQSRQRSSTLRQKCECTSPQQFSHAHAHGTTKVAAAIAVFRAVILKAQAGRGRRSRKSQWWAGGGRRDCRADIGPTVLVRVGVKRRQPGWIASGQPLVELLCCSGIIYHAVGDRRVHGGAAAGPQNTQTPATQRGVRLDGVDGDGGAGGACSSRWHSMALKLPSFFRRRDAKVECSQSSSPPAFCATRAV